MKSWTDVKQAYIKDHLTKSLKQPQRRLNALSAIESAIKLQAPNLLTGDALFKQFFKDDFSKKYESWKGNPLSSAEKSVIIGLYKFSE